MSTRSRMSVVLLELPYSDPTVLAIPFFLITLLSEAWLLSPSRRRDDSLRGYTRADTFGSLSLGIGSLLFVTFINLGIYKIASWLFTHRLFDLGAGPLGWIVAIVGWDLLYYWHHRIEHEVRLFWACHENHHSSRYFNLSTALRQPWTPVAGLLIYPWLALFGVRPTMIMIAAGLNLIYQYWVHTEIIGKLPAAFEAVFNTPSHHRVHHGKNPQYLDKNYGGIFIVWDRLFGTFEPERERVVYGLTKDIHSNNPLYIAFHEYGAMLRDVSRAPRFIDKLGHIFRGPGWGPVKK
jgi:sterol desaturase/sphingolipid hydroxylase (fatty acid hydroxylase superfamily)